jgi:hypothetical protein
MAELYTEQFGDIIGATCLSMPAAPDSMTGRWPAGHGVRDVAYFLCNSLPVKTRRSEQDLLLMRYRTVLAGAGGWLDADTVNRQHRLFAVYSRAAAVSTGERL